MTSKKNCCCGGCGTGCDGCNGTPIGIPASVTVSFTPWWLFAWDWEAGDIGCTQLGPTAPTTSCPGVYHFLSEPEWKQEHAKSVVCSLDTSDPTCSATYSGTVLSSTPTGLDTWSNNPFGVASTSSLWEEIILDGDEAFWDSLWGEDGLFETYTVTVTLTFERHDAGAGTVKNYMKARIGISLSNSWLDYDQCRGAFSTTTDADESGCGPSTWNTTVGGLSVACDNAFGIDCGQAEAKKWAMPTSLGSSGLSFSASRSEPCCEDLSATAYYYGVTTVEGSATADCPYIYEANTCGFNETGNGSAGEVRTVGTKYNTNSARLHYAEHYRYDLDPTQACMIEKLWYSGYRAPGLTDVGLA